MGDAAEQSTTMRAARLHGYGGAFSIEDVPAPGPPPGGAVVRVAGTGVCRSDLYVRSGRRPIIPEFPWTLGHENAGYIEALGEGASGFEIGEPVAVFGGWGCGGCRWCLGGEEHLCDLRYRCGSGRPGGYAELLSVPATRHLVSLGVLDPVQAAPLTDAGITSYRAVRKAMSGLYPGSAAVVIGVGGLGQFAIQYLRVLTAAVVFAVDTAAHSRERATRLGADVALDAEAERAVQEIRGLTAGEGAAAVLDFVGSSASLELAARVCARQGAIVLVGLAGGSLPYRYDGLPSEARLMSSTWGSRTDLQDVIALVASGKVSGEVEAHPLADINEVFARLEGGAVQGRAVLQP